MFFNDFDVLMLKILKNHFNIFSSKKHFKKTCFITATTTNTLKNHFLKIFYTTKLHTQ